MVIKIFSKKERLALDILKIRLYNQFVLELRMNFKKGERKMIITQEQAKALRRKKADLQLKNYEFAFEIGVAPRTVPKILNGDYKAPNRIYASVMEWLAKDY